MTRESVHAIVFRHLHETVPGSADRSLDESAPLQDIGIDSLDLVDVASRSMQELSVKIPRSEVGKIRTLNDLIEMLYQLRLAAS